VEYSLSLAVRIPREGVCASGTALPFRDSVFDVVVCSAARKHVRDTATLTREFLRVLRPGGRVLVIDPHPWVLGSGFASVSSTGAIFTIVPPRVRSPRRCGGPVSPRCKRGPGSL